MSALKRLWRGEEGFVVTTELVLVATLLVMAMVVGFQSVRDSVLAELADMGGAVGTLNQSYSISGFAGHSSWVAGSVWLDYADFCDTVGSPVGVGVPVGGMYQNQNQFSQCLALTAGTSEQVRPGSVVVRP